MASPDSDARQRTAHLRAPADIGLAIQQARLAHGWSQTALAARVGMSQRSISEIESGKATIMLRKLFELMRATGVELTAQWEDPEAS